MILTEVANELFETTGQRGLESLIDRYSDQVMNRFLRPDRRLLLEFLGSDWQELPGNEGTAVMPGHAIESMWFMLHVARRRGEGELIRRASEAIRWHLEAGWDPEYGGIFWVSTQTAEIRSSATGKRNRGGRTPKACTRCCWPMT